MQEEIWKRIPGYPMYEVSNKGRVKSDASKSTPGKIMKMSKNANGYWVVKLARGNSRGDNGYDLKRVHRLVAEAFIGVPEELKELGLDKDQLVVDHIIPVSEGGDILNADGTFNLRWTTTKGNVNNPISLKKHKEAMKKRKQEIYVYDEDLNQVSAFTSTLDAANILDKSQGNIASCCQGALKRYLGRIWSYVPLTDIKEREELEEKMEYQRQKNKESTNRAQEKYVKSIGYRVAYRRYYEAHREEFLERYRVYADANREELRQKGRERYHRIKDTEEFKQYRREYYQQNKEKIKAKSKEYYQAHREEMNEKAKERQRRKKNGMENDEKQSQV